MAKKRVYFETAAVSYLTADKPTLDIVQLARRQLTRQWWEHRDKWELFVSPAVLDEITEGHSGAAAKRVDAVRGLPVLADHPEARALARKLEIEAPIPLKSQADAAHLAFAAFYGMDYLVTWNQTHLDNPHIREKVNAILRGKGLSPAAVVTPEVLMEIKDD
ncbi:MAG: type II toxin-antitoxin system VapC family toxin [Planctomycetes bacterium]|nr:type II toxin-antitoxin system VapC family toxin [Planctomycetota bacterium]